MLYYKKVTEHFSRKFNIGYATELSLSFRKKRSLGSFYN